ncbi:MAG: DnaB-like helicase C-terminal domain-containing protein [Bdellovibrionales bacterium]|nr:DnaB-like helicase C-terminal domain-containing protein [Bdellovibrionales bacterium]
MQRRTFMKFLGLAPTAVLMNHKLVLAETFPTQTQVTRSNPTIEEALKCGPPKRAELVVITGRPSSGKSTLMLNLLDRFTFERNERSLFFSLERSRDNLIQRWRETTQHPEAFTGLMNADIYDTHRASPKNIRTVVEAAQIVNPDLSYVFIDYLQLIPWFERGREKADLADAILRALKRMAVELNVAVILAAQMNSGSDQKVSMLNLRGVTDPSPIDLLMTVPREVPGEEGTGTTY